MKTPQEFLKSNQAKKFKDVAFTKGEYKAIHTWMVQYARHIIKADEKQRRKEYTECLVSSQNQERSKRSA